jgi:hypothetical protein
MRAPSTATAKERRPTSGRHILHLSAGKRVAHHVGHHSSASQRKALPELRHHEAKRPADSLSEIKRSGGNARSRKRITR